MERRHFWLILGLPAVFVLLLAPVEKQSTLWARNLQDAAHAPMFALVAAGALIWLRTIGPARSVAIQYLFAFALALLIGGAGELAQALLTTTRNAEWDDLVTDALGASLGLGLMAAREPASRLSSQLKVRLAWPAILLATGAIILPLAELALAYSQRQQQLPELLTWDSTLGMRFARGSGADLSRASLKIGAQGTRSELLVAPHSHARWPGIAIEEPWPDWSGYDALEIGVRNPNLTALTLNLRIDDVGHNQQYADRFNHRFSLLPGQDATVRISIDQIEHGPSQRRLDLHNIAQLILFEAGGQQARPFMLHRMRLVRRTASSR